MKTFGEYVFIGLFAGGFALAIAGMYHEAIASFLTSILLGVYLSMID